MAILMVSHLLTNISPNIVTFLLLFKYKKCLFIFLSPFEDCLVCFGFLVKSSL